MDPEKVRLVQQPLSFLAAKINYVDSSNSCQEEALVVRKSQDSFGLEDEKDHFELLCKHSSSLYGFVMFA